MHTRERRHDELDSGSFFRNVGAHVRADKEEQWNLSARATAAITLFCERGFAQTLRVGSKNFTEQFMLDGHAPPLAFSKAQSPLTYWFSVGGGGANISLDAGTLEALDEAARAHGLSRSAFIASAAKEKIRRGT